MKARIKHDVAVIIDLDAIIQGLRDLGEDGISADALLDHLSRARGTDRVLRRVHVIVGREQPDEALLANLQRTGVDVHFAREGRPDCKVFATAVEMADCHDVIALCVASGAYVPLLRHLESLGNRIELHVLPNVDPKMLPVADVVIALPTTIALRECAVEQLRVVAA
jgi:NYN domain-containing protein